MNDRNVLQLLLLSISERYCFRWNYFPSSSIACHEQRKIEMRCGMSEFALCVPFFPHSRVGVCGNRTNTHTHTRCYFQQLTGANDLANEANGLDRKEEKIGCVVEPTHTNASGREDKCVSAEA